VPHKEIKDVIVEQRNEGRKKERREKTKCKNKTAL
jgi:hypothetical protein